MKKILSLLVALLLCLGALPAMAEEALEPVTFKFLFGNSMETPPDDNKIYKKIKDELGVTLEMDFLVGNSKEKLGVMIASGDYPDMMDGAGNGSYLVNSGILMPLEELITAEAYPSLYEFMQPQWNELKAPDGHIYFIPNDNREYNNEKNESPRFFDHGFWLCKDVLIDLDYPEIPTTLEEYFGLIEQYVAKNPTNKDGAEWVGFEIMCDASSWRSFPMRKAWQYMGGMFSDGGYTVDYENLTAVHNTTTEEARRYYKKINEMYNKGLVDPECFVQNIDEYSSKIASGRVLGMFDGAYQLWAMGTQRALGNPEYEFVPLALSLDEGVETYYRGAVPLRQSPYNGIALTITNKDPERCLKFLDAVASEEWNTVLFWGIEGEDYLVDENGMFYLTDEQLANHYDPSWKSHNTAGQLTSACTKRLGFHSDGNAYSWDNQLSVYNKNLGACELELLEHYGKKVDHQFVPYNTVGLYPPEYSANSISFEEGSIAAIVKQQCWDYESEWLPKLIMAPEGEYDALWDAYAAGYEKIDRSSMEEAVEEGLKLRREAYNKANGL